MRQARKFRTEAKCGGSKAPAGREYPKRAAAQVKGKTLTWFCAERFEASPRPYTTAMERLDMVTKLKKCGALSTNMGGENGNESARTKRGASRFLGRGSHDPSPMRHYEN